MQPHRDADEQQTDHHDRRQHTQRDAVRRTRVMRGVERAGLVPAAAAVTVGQHAVHEVGEAVERRSVPGQPLPRGTGRFLCGHVNAVRLLPEREPRAATRLQEYVHPLLAQTPLNRFQQLAPFLAHREGHHQDVHRHVHTLHLRDEVTPRGTRNGTRHLVRHVHGRLTQPLGVETRLLRVLRCAVVAGRR